MAFEKMLMVNIIGKYDMLDTVIEAYIESGCFHQENAAQFVENVKGFTFISEENPYAESLNHLKEILERAGFKEKTVKNPGPTPPFDVIQNKMKIIDERLGSLQNQKEKIYLNIKETEDTIDKLSHFIGTDIDFNDVAKSKYVKLRLGKMPVESYDKLKYYENNPYVMFTPCSNEGDFIWGVYVAPIESKTQVDNIFKSLFFETVEIPEGLGTPVESIEQLQSRNKKLRSEYKELCEIINEFNDIELHEYLELYTQLKHSYDAFEIRKFATKYDDTFLLVGWVPKSDVKKFSAVMDKIDAIEYSFEDAKSQKAAQPPIKLKNPKFAKPFEYYVEMFGVPSYNEIDPTLFMAITYTLLYGIMFADVGQGIILSIVGFLMYKLKGMELGKIIIPCGICGSIFGLVFGSVFGFEHLLDPMYKALGFEEKPIEVMSSINTILVMSVGIGVVMMICAILLNIYSCLKRRNVGEAIAGENGLCGLLLYLSVIVLVLSFLTSALVFLTIPAIIVIAVAMVVIMFKEPIIHLINGKKWNREAGIAEFVMQSFFEMFEAILSYVTNTVSFLRVGAFVLVHNGMMMVFFTLAEMMPNNVAYAIVIIFGNILVLVLEGLLVGIQSLRLEFYEMFSRFYSGEGKPFEPVGISK